MFHPVIPSRDFWMSMKIASNTVSEKPNGDHKQVIVV